MIEESKSAWGKLLDKLSGWLDTLILNLPNFLIASLIFILSYWIAKNLHGFTNKYLKKFLKQPSIRGLVANVVSVLFVVLGLMLALTILNLDGTLKSLLAGAGVAGLAISLALQGTLSNSFSGLFIAIKDEINVGDWIETNGFSGTVEKIDLRNTKVKEPDNNIVVIPNKMILDKPFKNFGLTKRIRCTINCGVAYESNLEKVKEIAIKTIEDTFPPSSDENIEFYYTDFGGSSIDFMLRFWVDATKKLTALQVKSVAIMKIKDTFDKNEINIPFPIRTLIMEDKNA